MGDVQWGEFEIHSIFDKLNLKFKKNHFDKDNDISLILTDEFSLPLVNAKDGNNGIMYYGRPNDFDSASMTIDIVGDGAVSTGNVYPQPQKTGVLYNAYLIQSDLVNTAGRLYFFAAAIQKSIKHKFGYENKAGWGKVKKEKILLPVCSGKIDFEFIDSFVAELEAQHVVELEAYLKATGLDNYELTEEEEIALDLFNKNNINWCEYNLSDLFGNATRGKRLKSEDRIEGDLPFVTAGENETGVSAFIGNDVQRFSSNTVTIDMFGSAKYRNYEYGADDHIAVVHTDKLDKLAAIFVTTSIHKASHTSDFSYSRNFYAKDADALNILLPVSDDKTIDYKYMSLLISGIQKLVIQEVVKFTKNKVRLTQQVIGS